MALNRPLIRPLTRSLTRPLTQRSAGGGGSPPAFDPASLFGGGIQGGWWDISDLSSLFQNSDGTGAVAVGDPVGYVTDKSGNGRHMIQATAAARPVLRQDGGSFYYLEYDGVDDTLDVPGSTSMFNFLHDGTGGSIYHGLSVVSDAANTNTIGTSINNAMTGCRFTRVAATDAAQFVVRAAGVGNVILLDTAGSTWAINTTIILGATYKTQAGNDCMIYLNGAMSASGAEAFTPASGNSGRTIGMPMTVTLASNWYGGLAIAKELSAGERGNYEAYLAARTGVTL